MYNRCAWGILYGIEYWIHFTRCGIAVLCQLHPADRIVSDYFCLKMFFYCSSGTCTTNAPVSGKSGLIDEALWVVLLFPVQNTNELE